MRCFCVFRSLTRGPRRPCQVSSLSLSLSALISALFCLFSLLRLQSHVSLSLSSIPCLPPANTVSPDVAGVAIFVRLAACDPFRCEDGVTGARLLPPSIVKYIALPDMLQIGGAVKLGQMPSGVRHEVVDIEPRCIILEFNGFVLMGVCAPYAGFTAAADEAQYNFLHALDVRVRNLLAIGKQVIVAGHFGMALHEIDTFDKPADAETWYKQRTRRVFNQLVDGGIVIGGGFRVNSHDIGRDFPVLHDIIRARFPDREGMYTYWDPTSTSTRAPSTWASATTTSSAPLACATGSSRARRCPTCSAPTSAPCTRR